MVKNSRKGSLVAMFRLADPNQMCYIISWDFYFYKSPKIILSDGNFMYFFLTNAIGYSNPLIIGFKVPLICTSRVYCERNPSGIITTCEKNSPSFSVPIVRLYLDDVFQSADMRPDDLQLWSYLIRIQNIEQFTDLCKKCLILKPPSDTPYLIGILRRSMYIIKYDPSLLNISNNGNIKGIAPQMINVTELAFLEFI